MNSFRNGCVGTSILPKEIHYGFSFCLNRQSFHLPLNPCKKLGWKNYKTTEFGPISSKMRFDNSKGIRSTQ